MLKHKKTGTSVHPRSGFFNKKSGTGDLHSGFIIWFISERTFILSHQFRLDSLLTLFCIVHKISLKATSETRPFFIRTRFTYDLSSTILLSHGNHLFSFISKTKYLFHGTHLFIGMIYVPKIKTVYFMGIT